MPKITRRAVDALRPDRSGKDIFHWDAGDGALKGFGIRMKPSGAASYLVQYRNKEGRTRRLVIGKVGTLTPDEARTLASDALRAAAKGSDPSAERHAVRGAVTVSELCDVYVAGSKGRIKPSTWAADQSRIETHVKPLIGRFTVRSLTTADIERMKADIIAGKTAKPRKTEGRGGVATGGAGVAARTLGMMATILEYARRSLKLIKENPARGVIKPPDRKQRRFLTIEEMAKLGQTIREAEARGGNAIALSAIRLLLLTGLRRMECLGLRRSWVDSRAGCIRFEDTKSGAQLRPIGKKALELIAARPVRDGCPWIFPASHGDGHLIGLPKILRRICLKAGLSGVTVHVLRHSFAATAAEMGFSELTIAGLLGHSVPGITARYAHMPDSALVAAADRVAARIASALNGKTKAEIIPLRYGVGGASPA
ncbi:site-specific integrase [Bradyrhizobium sp. JYMT SZCCT0428]|uniref:tyrosine-type recombinase/integrase n=1 Tax=Bradyrhizobium sp. JYMT SZCCT0428 TaxID=2807673 RepID=UPI001BA555CF|nr:site-specific integrase [Bradyrhizobium sp. JYMT SZCCT0428]MBR1153743.1 tyrosine-type recombinase/integrase [Bradyrhizobium sp. JYMT SZCCT0428]